LILAEYRGSQIIIFQEWSDLQLNNLGKGVVENVDSSSPLQLTSVKIWPDICFINIVPKVISVHLDRDSEGVRKARMSSGTAYLLSN
jgi:hypothetical protein